MPRAKKKRTAFVPRVMFKIKAGGGTLIPLCVTTAMSSVGAGCSSSSPPEQMMYGVARACFDAGSQYIPCTTILKDGGHDAKGVDGGHADAARDAGLAVALDAFGVADVGFSVADVGFSVADVGFRG